MPSSTPTASPRLRRRRSPWPPHRRRITGFGVDPTSRRGSRAALRPISTRLEPATRLRSITTGSSRTPSRLACRTRTVWQYRRVPALSGLLTARTVRPHGRTAPSFNRPAATDRRRVPSPRPVSDGASRRTATSCRNNAHRPHQGIANARPLVPLPEPITNADRLAHLNVHRRDRLGGLLPEYEHAV